VLNSGNELEIVRTKTSFRVSRVRSGQNPDVRAARRQVRDGRVFHRAILQGKDGMRANYAAQ